MTTPPRSGPPPWGPGRWTALAVGATLLLWESTHASLQRPELVGAGVALILAALKGWSKP
ncbi:MAG: hypothetical protein R3C15_15405 [Thermoleophilia bacterium]